MMTPDDSGPESPRLLYHYTDKAGYNSIRAGVDWRFKAHTPPPRDKDHPHAVYFTTWDPDFPNLDRLRLPVAKRQYVFAFEDAGDLEPLRGGRGSYTLYSRQDYVVDRGRQRDFGESSEVAARLRLNSGKRP